MTFKICYSDGRAAYVEDARESVRTYGPSLEPSF